LAGLQESRIRGHSRLGGQVSLASNPLATAQHLPLQIGAVAPDFTLCFLPAEIREARVTRIYLAT
jgi:hypothetical protein